MAEKMGITVHRPHQIGGCVTEITCGETRIFVDFGSSLPGSESFGQELDIRGLTCGESRCDGVFFTHMHGDHMGQIHRINPDIPLWMGVGTKRLELLLLNHLSQRLGEDTGDGAVVNKKREAVSRAQVFFPGKPLEVGELTITPLLVDHSAFDAYMLLIEGGGVRVLHTGDFRTHGYLGPKLQQVLEKYAKKVDVIVCEGTMMSRENEEVITEKELSDRARDIMLAHKRVFVVCSSMNIARLEAFSSAVPDGRVVTCDDFQWEVMDCVTRHSAKPGGPFDFSQVRRAQLCSPEFRKDLEERGFLCFIRPNGFGSYMLDKYGDGAKVVYSQWAGYLDPENPAADRRLMDFLKGRDVCRLHTSGHATPEAIRMLVKTVKPRCGVIPIHTDCPGAFERGMAGVRVQVLTPWDAAKRSLNDGAPERLRREAEAGLRERFGGDPPEFAARRLEDELSQIDGRGARVLLFAKDAVEEVRASGGTFYLNGCYATLLTACLLGLGELDPLPAHYRCGKCHYAALGDAPVGPELPDRVCPVCGQALEKSGFALDQGRYFKFMAMHPEYRRIYFFVPPRLQEKRGSVLLSSFDGMEVFVYGYAGYDALEDLRDLTGVSPEAVPLDDRAALERLTSPEFKEMVESHRVLNPELLSQAAKERPDTLSGVMKLNIHKRRSYMVRLTLLAYRLAWYALHFPAETAKVLSSPEYRIDPPRPESEEPPPETGR